MTHPKQPFARRIVIAFTLMTLVVSGFFSLSIVAIVHFVERHLVSQELKSELDTVINQDIRQGHIPRLDSATRFFASDLPPYAIPESLRHAEKGFSELREGERAYYIYVMKRDGQTYMLVEDQSEFEAREQMLFRGILFSFLLSVVGAWLLGLLLARKVIAPVIRLARQVRHRDQLLPLAPPLAPEYPDDEVGHLAAAFDSTLGQLRQSLERERLFTSDVSHELRTPLMVIQGSCELLRETELPAQANRQVERIGRAAQEMHELVQTFLILARARREEAASGGSATLASVAEEQSRRWGPPIRAKGLNFELVVEDTDSASYNLTFLSTVLSNLLRNALHYTENGTVRLILEKGGFRVEDSGAGIPAEHRERIFQPFVRGEQARGEGLGLGLSLVKRICTHQGWQVRVSDLEPSGSCFRVSLK
ncbi:sensory histidine protein kinase, two-component, ColS [Azotobacter vinelandii CA]|uniref:histidine kinase n=2 Tax=Azotobacter vinelandii TaxID=354 RepID=C1DDM1_AZOVD|nr:HAMP domain-containing sensor histidine kinase [Azotobacter vinelandii]ACO77992.1 sensory histidine protein kinase, two-component, ColS [Azotobacter vinelandii DJ]AGK13335.1 sensory histidine protein kinase, two-component, ColS [Azotobacter vinelandii CA]AGK17684.1 sensory histidine protein kinase, two-component, ColS [Azotobacter vinelandii CA6]WKN23717.1 HAMP domain-containing histidine kinase [Azotobacter vinelandii]SFX91878.1 Signal transduction histidine kinase [Azotobacter vinelandii]